MVIVIKKVKGIKIGTIKGAVSKIAQEKPHLGIKEEKSLNDGDEFVRLPKESVKEFTSLLKKELGEKLLAVENSKRMYIPIVNEMDLEIKTQVLDDIAKQNSAFLVQGPVAMKSRGSRFNYYEIKIGALENLADKLIKIERSINSLGWIGCGIRYKM